MKKVILSMLAFATLTFTTSCSDDSESANVPGAGSVVVSEGGIAHTQATALVRPTWQDISLTSTTGATTTLAAETLTTDLTVSGVVELTGIYTVADGATLTIEAGTEIIASNGAEVYFLVLRGGKINVQGTEASPVIMSSATATAGDWGGLVICGKAVTTSGVDASAEVGTGLLYGGTDAADNSGSIEYLVLKGAGNFINADAQFNGITFYAVGSGTTVNNVAVIDGDDDGVEFFGGSVNVTDLYLQDNADDSVDWTEGYSGTVTNIYIQHDKDFSTAFEGDGTDNSPTFENVTAISSLDGVAFQFKKASGAELSNLHLDGYSPEIQFRDEDQFLIENVTVDGDVVVIE